MSTKNKTPKLLQTSIANEAFKELAEWILINKRSVFQYAGISKESKRKILHALGYSSNSLDN